MSIMGSGPRLAVGGILLCVMLGGADSTWSESLPPPLIFADDFESGDASAWSSTVGYLPLPGFGALSGACGVLNPTNLDGTAPDLFVSVLDFGTDPYDDLDFPLLTSGGQEIITSGLGGKGDLRDAFAFEVLARCELATLLKTKAEIIYVNPSGTIASFSVQIDGFVIGVTTSVAISFPFTEPYTVAQATAMLEDKLASILSSSANVAPADAWGKQVLAILAYAPGHVASIETAWAAIDPTLRADTLVLVIVTEGDDSPLY